MPIITLLLEAKAEVNRRTAGGCSALWKASNEGHGESVRLLLDRQASVNLVQTKTNISPLYNACYRGHDDVVQMLVSAKAGLNYRRKQTGASPLYTACENGHIRVLGTSLAL